MQGSLGEKIGEGAYSEAYAWAPGQIVKLFKPGLPRPMPWFEGRMLRDVLALIDRLPPGDNLCHGDLTPGNVIMTADGPKLVDWVSAMRGPAVLDLGFLHVILSEVAPEIVDNPERPRATNAAVQTEYAR